MALILPRNWCLIFFRDPKAEFDASRLKKALGDAGLTVTGRKEPFKVRWGDGPTMQVSIFRGKSIETIVRGLVGKQRKYAKLVKGCDAQVKIELDNVEEVLDEINTLIEVQTTLQSATQGLMYNSWNDRFSGPED